MITAVTPAVLTLLLILLGLPLLAWWLGGRRFWDRLRPGRLADPWGDFVRRHGLSAAEQFRVQQAVSRGTALEGSRLRAAAVDLARETTAQLQGFRRPSSRAGRVLLLLAVLWLVLAVAHVAVAIAHGDWAEVPWFALVAVLVGSCVRHVQTRNLRRAIELNRDPGT